MSVRQCPRFRVARPEVLRRACCHQHALRSTSGRAHLAPQSTRRGCRAVQTDWIQLRGVRVHNLKGVDVEIPTNRLTVISGVSGSGKSSLAFDTLYAKARRRYLQSFSTYTPPVPGTASAARRGPDRRFAPCHRCRRVFSRMVSVPRSALWWWFLPLAVRQGGDHSLPEVQADRPRQHDQRRADGGGPAPSGTRFSIAFPSRPKCTYKPRPGQRS